MYFDTEKSNITLSILKITLKKLLILFEHQNKVIPIIRIVIPIIRNNSCMDII